MSVFNKDGKVGFVCDICGTHSPMMKTFSKSLEMAKDCRWKNVKEKGVWQHYCLACQIDFPEKIPESKAEREARHRSDEVTEWRPSTWRG